MNRVFKHRAVAVVLALASLAGVVTSSSTPAGADDLSTAVEAARASIPAEVWDSVVDLLPQTEAEATPRHFSELTVAQQSIVLQSVCTQLSNGVVVFTCEDEMEYVNNHSAAWEIAYLMIEASNAAVADCPDVQTNCPADALAANTADYVIGDPAVMETLAALVASALPQGSEDFDQDELRSFDLYPVGVQVIMPSGRMMMPDPMSLLARYRCGYIYRPNPRRAEIAQPGPLQGSSSTQAGAARLARQWGYSQGFHDTPGRAGGGMTRPQTWNPVLCGIGTYRDHAVQGLFTERTCYGAGGTPPCEWRARLMIQDYTAAPYGEPNPEFWRTTRYPYPEWPAYVAFWHYTR